jgi:hypothetical protein
MIHTQAFIGSLPDPGPRPSAPVRLLLADGVLAETQELLRSSSAGQREALVLWAGRPHDSGALITHLIGPDVDADYDRLDVPGTARAEVAAYLRSERLLVFADLHTHPTEAFLSLADQVSPYSTLAGFHAIVIPDFAAGAPGARWRMYTYTGSAWKENDCAQWISPWTW